MKDAEMKQWEMKGWDTRKDIAMAMGMAMAMAIPTMNKTHKYEGKQWAK